LAAPSPHGLRTRSRAPTASSSSRTRTTWMASSESFVA
jgi:hypothetical protein